MQRGKATFLPRQIVVALPRSLALDLPRTARRLHDHTSKTQAQNKKTAQKNSIKRTE